MANIKKINVGGIDYEVRSDLEERIKTLEEQETGGGGEVVVGTTDYSQLENKPSINNVTLEGNKTLDELGIASKQSVEGKQDAISQVNVTVNDTDGTPSGSAFVSGSTLNINLENIKGRSGEAGPANTITIGTVTPSDSPDEASATLTGESPNQVLNLVLPRGQQGNSGVNGSTADIVVVNDLNGGESETASIKVLAAEQGKVLKNKINDVNYCSEESVELQSGYYDNSGNVGDTPTLQFTNNVSFVSAIIDVTYNDRFVITGTGGSVPRTYSILDSENRIIEVAEINAKVNDKTIEMPSDGKKLIVNFSKSYEYSIIKKITVKDKISDIDQKIKEYNLGDGTKALEEIETVKESIFTNADDPIFSATVEAAPDKKVKIMDYLGKAECEFTISGNKENGYFSIQADNVETGTTFNLKAFMTTPGQYPVTFVNPNPNIEFENVCILFYSSQQSDNVTVSIKKSGNGTKALEEIETVKSQIQSDFNSDTQDWVFTKKISVSPNKKFPVIDYLGAIDFEITIDGSKDTAFAIDGTDIETGSEIRLENHTEPISLPFTFSNSRSDLELKNLIFVAFSKAATDNITITIKKKSPFVSIKENVKSLLSEEKLISDMNFDIFMSDDMFSGIIDNKASITSDETYQLYDDLMSKHPDYITKTLLGNEATGIPMYRYDFKVKQEQGGDAVPVIKIMILSGTHPEYIAIRSLYKVMESIAERWESNKAIEALRWNVDFIIIPIASPWAVDNNSRVNSNGVDMARNFPAGWVQGSYVEPPSLSSTYGGTEPLSELEAQYINNVLEENTDIVLGIDFHNQYSQEYTFWTAMYKANSLEYRISCAFMKLINRLTKKKFDYISDSYKIGIVDTGLPGGSFGRQVYEYSSIGMTFESCNNNIAGFSNKSDIITITHDAFINFLNIYLRNII